MRIMKMMGLFLLLGLILLPSFIIYRAWRLDMAYRYEFQRYFVVPYPEDEEMRRDALPIVSALLFEYRFRLPDLELRSLERDIAKAGKRFDGTPESFTNLREAMARRDVLVKNSRGFFFDFAYACHLATRVYGKQTLRYGPMVGGKKMLHESDCPKEE